MVIALVAIVAAAAVAAVIGIAAWRRARRRASRRIGLALVRELTRVDRLSVELERALQRFERRAELRRWLRDLPPAGTPGELVQWAAETGAALEHVSACVVRAAGPGGAALVAAHGIPLDRAREQSIAWPHPTLRAVSFAFDYRHESDETIVLRSALAVPLGRDAPGDEFVAVFSQATHAPSEALIDALEALASRLGSALDATPADEPREGATGHPSGRGRSRLLRVLAREVHLAGRTGTPLVLVLIELDGFPALRRRSFPDPAVAAVETVVGFVRDAAPDAIAAHVAGGCVAVVAPGAGLAYAEHLVAAVRAAMRDTAMTVSAGIAELDPDEDWSWLLTTADDALQHAKATGHDMVVVARARRFGPAVSARAATPR